MVNHTEQIINNKFKDEKDRLATKEDLAKATGSLKSRDCWCTIYTTEVGFWHVSSFLYWHDRIFN